MITETRLSMSEIGARIAEAMGDGWDVDDKADTNSAYCVLRQKGSDPHLGIGLYRNSREKKIFINPKWPTSADGTEFPYRHNRADVSIGVGMNREPIAIAREITRRFLPGYREEFSRGVDQRNERDDYLANQNANPARFSELLGGIVRGETVDVRMGDADRCGYINGMQVGGNTVQWEFRSMPIDLAVEILTLWKSCQS